MDKITLSQVVWGIVQFLGYVGAALAIAYAFVRKITTIELNINNTTKRLDEHIVRVEKMFDRLWDEKFRK